MDTCKSESRAGMPARLAVGALASLLAFASGSALAAISGAIYTSDSSGTKVNQNIYPNKEAVYLNGGPQNQNAAGLPNGTYYFQVTDPNGETLLSTDNAVCRKLTVANGVVSGTASPCPAPNDHPNGSYNAANLSTPVQLAPYLDTPNAGGEYKAWLISTDWREGCGPTAVYVDSNDPRVLVFPQNCAKTDNFKVGAQPPVEDTPVTIGGRKFYDTNTDSLLSGGEVGIPGFRIQLSFSLNNVPQSPILVTNANGDWSYGLPKNTAYRACEVMPTGSWIQTAPIQGDQTSNTLGTADSLQCWYGLASDGTSDLNFGNVCTGAGNGYTLGFWSNNNGKARLGTNQNKLSFLSTNNLVKPDGTSAELPSGNNITNNYTTFRNWLLNGNAVNMAYMLSVQSAAMILNVNVGGQSGVPVSSSALVFAGTSVPTACQALVQGKLNAAGFITIGDLLAASKAALGLAPSTPAPDANGMRSCQEYLKNALDSANNNKNFVQANACPVVYNDPLPQ